MMFLGAPAIYYGDEIGITGDNDPDCRRCMEWDESKWNRELLEYYRALGEIRNNNSCIQTGKLMVNLNEGRVLGFIRCDEDDEIIVVANSDDAEATVTVPVLKEKDYCELETQIRYAAQPWDKASGCNGDVLPYEGQIQLKLGAYETKIIRRRTL
jgi:glycosidase